MKNWLILFLFAPIALWSQENKVRFGVYGDPKISWFVPESDIIDNNGVKAGINYGLTFDNFFTENYAFATGVSLNNVGGKLFLKDTFNITVDDSSYLVSSKLGYNMQYIRIPIGLKLLTNEIGYKTFYADLGVSPEILIKTTTSIDGLGISKGNGIKNLSFFNLSYYVGGGLLYSLGGSTSINVGIYYTKGFWKLTKFKDKVTLNSVSFRLGLIF